jgi:hypothetical protein
VGPDLLELADVGLHFRRGGGERPQVADALAIHVEKARPVRSAQPLVQAHPVVVAVQLGAGGGEAGEAMGAVHDHGDAARPSQRHDLAHGKDLPREVDHLTGQDQARAGRERAPEARHHLGGVLRGDRQGEGAQDDPLPSLTLPEGGQHPRIVLIGGHHLVPAGEREAALQDLQGLGGVPGERHLLGVTAEEGGDPPANGFLPGLQQLPEDVGRAVFDSSR